MIVGRQDNVVWLAVLVDSEGIQSLSFPVLFKSASCDGQPYAIAENSPVPLFRLLQRTGSTSGSGFYPGNPVVTDTFQGYSATGNPADCQPTLNSGWDVPLPAGPLQTIDLTPFPAPFTIR